MTVGVDPASFRDPSGYVFTWQDTLYRRVEPVYGPHYEQLMGSGLYDKLVSERLLVPHAVEEAASELPDSAGSYRILRPDRVSFLSYPYEWSFSQLQDAALTTLRIQTEALRHSMWLKDASAYNIQFQSGRPVFIDTLSFEVYKEGQPWPAYRQFCEHFLAPLVLMSRADVRLGQLLRIYLGGVPLDLASRLLPGSTKLDAGLLTHIHVHAASQKRFEGKAVDAGAARGRFGKTALLGLIDSLEGTVRKLSWRPQGTTWGDYYSATNYSERAMAEKQELVSGMLRAVAPAPRLVWDLGANTGVFSRLAAELGALTVAWDIDPGAVEKNYQDCRATGASNVLPLLQDLTNPSPCLGWALEERRSFSARGPADVLMALALVHHLAIGNNVPLDRIARFFRSLSPWLIVEFVPKSDSQVQRLLASREDVFPAYEAEGFEAAFSSVYEVVRTARVSDSERTLYLMRGRDVDV